MATYILINRYESDSHATRQAASHRQLKLCTVARGLLQVNAVHERLRLERSYIAGIPPAIAHGLSLKLSPRLCSLSSLFTAGQITALSACVKEVCYLCLLVYMAILLVFYYSFYCIADSTAIVLLILLPLYSNFIVLIPFYWHFTECTHCI